MYTVRYAPAMLSQGDRKKMKISHNSLSSSPLSFTANIIVLLVIPSVNNLSALRNAAAVPRSSVRPTVRCKYNSSTRKEKGHRGRKTVLRSAITELSAINQLSRGREEDEARKTDEQMDCSVAGEREERTRNMTFG